MLEQVWQMPMNLVGVWIISFEVLHLFAFVHNLASSPAYYNNSFQHFMLKVDQQVLHGQ